MRMYYCDQVLTPSKIISRLAHSCAANIENFHDTITQVFRVSWPMAIDVDFIGMTIIAMTKMNAVSVLKTHTTQILMVT